MKTIAEKLEGKVGHKVQCSICEKRKEFDYRWCMTADKNIVCPGCLRKAMNERLLLVSI